MGMRGLSAIAACGVAALLALGGCDDKKAVPAPLTPVRVEVVETHSLGSALQYSANIEPTTQVNLAFKVGGYITWILQKTGADGKQRDVQTGDPVDRGTVLAKVDEEPYQDKVEGAKSQLDQAKAALSKGENDYRRASALFKEQSMTATEFDTYKKEYQASLAAVAGAKAQLDDAELDLKYTNLTSPLTGVMLQRNIEIGALASPGSVGFVLADVSAVKAVFGVPAAVLGDVKEGSPMAITTESEPGRRFNGTITSIAAAADSSSRVFNVEITVPNADGRLKPGMVASLAVARGAAPAGETAVVPLAAIVRSGTDPKGYAVFLADGAGDEPVARLRDVKVGRILGDTIAVTGSIKSGERVVVYGATLIHDGDKVRIIP
jgi:RND family efflux transporter MFP subunit